MKIKEDNKYNKQDAEFIKEEIKTNKETTISKYENINSVNLNSYMVFNHVKQY